MTVQAGCPTPFRQPAGAPRLRRRVPHSCEARAGDGFERLRGSRIRNQSPTPTGPSELNFLSVDTRTPYVVDYPGEDSGTTGHYMLRWVATTGEKGPWGETASATTGA